MAIELLSDTTLRALKAGATEYKGKQRLDDGGGLVLLLSIKGGGKAWRFNYTFAGKRKMISFGKYPDTTLATARDKAKAARQQVADGIDPSSVRKEKKADQQTQIEDEKCDASGLPAIDSFAHIALEWFDGRKHTWSDSHASRTLAYIEKDLMPWIGRSPIADIEAPTLLQCLRRVEARGASEAANRLRAMAGQIWRYAIATGKAKRDIAADLIGALTPHVSKQFLISYEAQRAAVNVVVEAWLRQ